MKTKNAKGWADHIGESELPVDEFTFTEGSNYGLDGFGFDKRMNEGVEQSARLPSVRGLSGLPDGMVSNPDGSDLPDDKLTDDKTGFDLSSMLSEEEGALPLSKSAKEAASLVDLSWLDPTQKQDPARLPKGLHPEVENANASIPELVDAWGDGKQTTGLELVPGIKDREVAQYKDDISSGPKSGLPGKAPVKTATEVRDAVLRAMRRSVMGWSLKDIKAELGAALGSDAHRAKKAMAQIEAEHGLAGKVFIRAAAYPGLKNGGDFLKVLQRVAKTARYVITDDQGIADKLKMEAVSAVPWKKALAHYRPLLTASGHRVASVGDPQEILRNAFLMGPEEASVKVSNKPVDVRPADRVSEKQAKQAFAETTSVERQVVDGSARPLAIKRRKALVRIAKWVRAGLLSREDALKLRESNASPVGLLKTGALLIVASGKSVPYSGSGNLQIQKVASTREGAWAVLRAAEEEEAKEAERLSRLAKEAAVAPEAEEGSYKGPAFKWASSRPQADKSDLDRKQAGRVERFARQQMSEGMAGADLDAMLQAKFAKPVRTAAKSMLKVLRNEHEGLSGHLYVDASAYLSPTGIAGCEEGALKHRANALKFVLEAERCSGCVHASEGRCKLYRKVLAEEIPTKDPKAYQRKILAATKATDAEKTASYFEHSEFDLESPLEDLELNESASTEALGDILFGELQV